MNKEVIEAKIQLLEESIKTLKAMVKGYKERIEEVEGRKDLQRHMYFKDELSSERYTRVMARCNGNISTFEEVISDLNLQIDIYEADLKYLEIDLWKCNKFPESNN